MNRKVFGFGIILATLLAPIMVLASVTFDPFTGKGFVGKGDVQIPFGWNNAQLQANALQVSFTYSATNTYTVTEAWATGNPDNPWTLNSHTTTIPVDYSISSTLDGSPRQVKGQRQFTGFILTGFIGDPVVVGTLPTEDPVDWNTIIYDRKIGQTWYYGLETELLPFDADGNLYIEGNYKAVLSVELTSSTGGLYANFGVVSVLIWPPVV